MSRKMVAPGRWEPEAPSVGREHSLLASVERQGFLPGVLATTVSDRPISGAQAQQAYRARQGSKT